MVALPTAPYCVRFRVLGKINNQPIAHILHATYGTGSVSGADATAFSLSFRNAWSTRFGTLLPTTVTYNTFECVDLGSLSGAVGTTTTAVTGTSTNAAGVPNSACAVISWKVLLRYRGGHARTYLPYSNAGSLLAGNGMPTAYITSLKAAAAGFLTDVNAMTSGTNTLTFCVVSYFQNKQMRPNGIPIVINSSNVGNRIDTQRRRNGKEF